MPGSLRARCRGGRAPRRLGPRAAGGWETAVGGGVRGGLRCFGGAYRRVGARGIPAPRWEPRNLCPHPVPKPSRRSSEAEGGERRRGPGAPGRGWCGRTCSLPPTPIPAAPGAGALRSLSFGGSGGGGGAGAAACEPSPVGTAPPAAAGPPAAGRCRSAGGDPRLPSASAAAAGTSERVSHREPRGRRSGGTGKDERDEGEDAGRFRWGDPEGLPPPAAGGCGDVASPGAGGSAAVRFGSLGGGAASRSAAPGALQ